MKAVFFSIMLGIFGIVSAATKVGYIDIEKVYPGLPQVKLAEEKITKEFAPKEKELRAEAQALQKMINDYSVNQATLSKEESDKQAAEIKKREAEIKAKGQKFGEEYNQKRRMLSAGILKIIDDEIKAYALEQNYDIILFQPVAYVKDSADLTEKIYQRLLKQEDVK